MTLIANWKQSWRFTVMWVQGFGATAMSVWVLLTDEQRTSILGLFGITPDKTVAIVAISIFVAGMVARITAQPNLGNPEGIENEVR